MKFSEREALFWLVFYQYSYARTDNSSWPWDTVTMSRIITARSSPLLSKRELHLSLESQMLKLAFWNGTSLRPRSTMLGTGSKWPSRLKVCVMDWSIAIFIWTLHSDQLCCQNRKGGNNQVELWRQSSTCPYMAYSQWRKSWLVLKAGILAGTHAVIEFVMKLLVAWAKPSDGRNLFHSLAISGQTLGSSLSVFQSPV